MKKFLALALCLCSLNVFADVTVFKTGFINRTILGTFKVNPELGRAWVEVEVYGSHSDSDSDYYRVKVDGLSYDAQTKEVVWDYQGERIVCARETTAGRSIFRYTYIKNIDCDFKLSSVVENVDDGFEVVRRKYAVLKLVRK